MASNCRGCFHCGKNVENLQPGWRLKDSTYAQLCRICSFAFEQGIFCHMYHMNEDGWRNCNECEKLVHCGCIMGLRTFELTDACKVMCKECAMKRTTAEESSDSDSDISTGRSHDRGDEHASVNKPSAPRV